MSLWGEIPSSSSSLDGPGTSGTSLFIKKNDDSTSSSSCIIKKQGEKSPRSSSSSFPLNEGSPPIIKSQPLSSSSISNETELLKDLSDDAVSSIPQSAFKCQHRDDPDLNPPTKIRHRSTSTRQKSAPLSRPIRPLFREATFSFLPTIPI